MLRVFALAAALGVVACGGKTQSIPDAPTSPWTAGPPLPTPRLEPGVVALGQQVVVVDGFNSGLLDPDGLQMTTAVDVYDIATQTWNLTQLPDAPVAWTHLQLASIGTTIYLLGGLGLQGDNFPAFGNSWKLDTGATPLAWQPLTSIPAGYERGSAAVIVSGTKIYLLGGASTTDAVASNLSYDTVADAWSTTELPDLPDKRSHPAGMRLSDGTLVLAGGLAGLTADTFHGDVWWLPPGASAWDTTHAAMPDGFARGGCAYGTLTGPEFPAPELVCAGGEAGTSALSSILVYDPMTDTWIDSTTSPDHTTELPMATAGTQGALISQRLYVAGGARQLVFEPTDTFYVYDPTLDTVAPF
ncbi:MAG TPA: hypothetical protein VLX92_18925 [Kofleriaceae bacterium]|nr:hypothetical protein [Kofleriaceae bacterium]